MTFAPGQLVEMPDYAIPPLHLPLPVTVLGPCTCQTSPGCRLGGPRYTIVDAWGIVSAHVREDMLRGPDHPRYTSTTRADIEAARAAQKEAE